MFTNRKEAGEELADALLDYKTSNPLILAIPRGGAEVGYYIARKLESDFNVILSRKLGHPRQPEAAFGAIAEDKSLYLDPWYRNILDKELIEEAIEREEAEIKRRIELYREGKPLPEIDGRTVILVDDGIATGATVFAAIELCQKKRAGKIIVAAPVSGMRVYEKLIGRADETVILQIPPRFFAVSQFYESFPPVTDSEVVDFLRRYKIEKVRAKGPRGMTERGLAHGK